ncbi:MAG: cytochrome c maturation protein CcmE [Acidobacteria bacterium]|nr:cytochrome c maturation protein CcmE [Acidobacteriota bacterium]
MAAKPRKLKFALGVVLILSTLAWLGYSGVQESKTYYVTVAELLASPDASHRRYRVAGDVTPGSIQRAEGRVRFQLEQEGTSLPVVYTGSTPLPDTFQDGAEAIADGRYQSDGTFYAETIQAKCASKYEPAAASAEGTSSPPTKY